MLSLVGTTDENATIAHRAVDFASALAQRYQISSVAPLLASCRSALSNSEVSVAVVGRFKAGKSSLINHIANRAILPVGVVPVTAIVTEIHYGPIERAQICFLNGHVEHVEVDGIAAYVTERNNPENCKRVRLITVSLPALERFQGLNFVDTPGLESALLHNTEAALRWLPNVGLALVAVSVDPPLSQHDIELLKKLYQFTPNVIVLLTKADLLAPEECCEVTDFVNGQLARAFESPPRVTPYSIRPGYEDFRAALERNVFQPLMARFGDERRAIAARKIDTLLRECCDYVTLSLRSAEALDTEREALKDLLARQRQIAADVKSQLRLIARHATAGTRSFVENRFQSYQKGIEDRILRDLDTEFPNWTKGLGYLLDSFDRWLSSSISDLLREMSAMERSRLTEPSRAVAGQMFRILQDFRDRLSDCTMRAFGIPLRTTEVEIEVHEPESPDIRIGKIFDRNWELLSPVVPLLLIKRTVRHHFERQISYKVSTNVSRLASQWEDTINSTLLNLEKEAERRLDELVATVGRLIETSEVATSDRVPMLQEDLKAIRRLLGRP